MNTPSRWGTAIVIHLVLLLGSAAAPAAELPRIRLEGVVERVQNHPFGPGQLPPPWDQVQAGDAWSVTYAFDPAAPDLDPSPSFGAYPAAIQWFEVQVGTITRTLTVGPAAAELRVFNDQPVGADQYEAFFNWEEGGGLLLMFFQLDDLQNQSFATDALPDCLDLASFGDARDFMISAGFGGGLDGISGQITGIACSPRIVRHPQDLNVTTGQPASFEVEIAPGGTPATYQWERDCGTGFVPISDATNRVHAIAATTPADACQYRCVVSSLDLASTSLAASLTVALAPAPPVITQQPEAVTLEEGDVASFSVTATGAEPLHYQWLLDDVPIQDATNAVLLLGPVTTDLSGTMTVRVSNGDGTLFSQGAPLTVTPLGNNATGTRVPVDATICFSNASSGAVADCIADWAALGRRTFLGGSYSARTVHTRQGKWCPNSLGAFTFWWPCHFDDTSDPTAPIPGGGPVAGSVAGATSTITPLLLLGHDAYWQDHCTVWPPLTFPPIGWEPAGFGYVHQVNVTMTLGNGDEYVFAPRNSPPLGAKELTPKCPPEPMTICECPTVVELCFVDCATGLPVAINGDRFTATIVGGPFNGVQQASGTIGNATCRKIFLRSGEQYSLTMDYHTGTSYFTDRINWRTTFQVDTRSHDCVSDGPLRVSVPCFRDPNGQCLGAADPSCPYSEAFGNLNLLRECEHDLSPN